MMEKLTKDELERIYRALLCGLGGGADIVEWRWADINKAKAIRQLLDEIDRLNVAANQQ